MKMNPTLLKLILANIFALTLSYQTKSVEELGEKDPA